MVKSLLTISRLSVWVVHTSIRLVSLSGSDVALHLAVLSVNTKTTMLVNDSNNKVSNNIKEYKNTGTCRVGNVSSSL